MKDRDSILLYQRSKERYRNSEILLHRIVWISGPEKVDLFDFANEGWRRAREKIENVERDIYHQKLYAQELSITSLDEKMVRTGQH